MLFGAQAASCKLHRTALFTPAQTLLLSDVLLCRCSPPRSIENNQTTAEVEVFLPSAQDKEKNRGLWPRSTRTGRLTGRAWKLLSLPPTFSSTTAELLGLLHALEHGRCTWTATTDERRRFRVGIAWTHTSENGRQLFRTRISKTSITSSSERMAAELHCQHVWRSIAADDPLLVPCSPHQISATLCAGHTPTSGKS